MMADDGLAVLVGREPGGGVGFMESFNFPPFALQIRADSQPASGSGGRDTAIIKHH